ncbi:unnamed protein product [Sympodiomycopsis kandeliae]
MNRIHELLQQTSAPGKRAVAYTPIATNIKSPSSSASGPAVFFDILLVSAIFVSILRADFKRDNMVQTFGAVPRTIIFATVMAFVMLLIVTANPVGTGSLEVNKLSARDDPTLALVYTDAGCSAGAFEVRQSYYNRIRTSSGCAPFAGGIGRSIIFKSSGSYYSEGGCKTGGGAITVVIALLHREGTMAHYVSNHPTIVCLGDSQTQYSACREGFVSRLSEVYQRRADVVNRGFSGYTTRDVVPLLPTIFSSNPSQGPNIIAVTIWLGCNDSINETESQYVSPEDYIRNLRTIIDTITNSGQAQDSPYILVISPTPVQGLQFHNNERKKLYTSLVDELVQDFDGKSSQKIDFINAYDLFANHKEKLSALLDADGIHISPEGYKVLTAAFLEKLSAQPALKPETMPLVFPDWKTFK